MTQLSSRAQDLIKEAPNRTAEIYNAGFKKGNDHCEPSKKTLELYENMANDIDTIKRAVQDQRLHCANITGEMKGDIKTILQELKHLNDANAEMAEAQKNFFSNAEEKFAGKWVEQRFTQIVIGISLFAILTVVYVLYDNAGLPHN